MIWNASQQSTFGKPIQQLFGELLNSRTIHFPIPEHVGVALIQFLSFSLPESLQLSSSKIGLRWAVVWQPTNHLLQCNIPNNRTGSSQSYLPPEKQWWSKQGSHRAVRDKLQTEGCNCRVSLWQLHTWERKQHRVKLTNWWYWIYKGYVELEAAFFICWCWTN